MNIIVSAGGSGGHIYPALEIIKKIKSLEKGVNVLYIGTHNRMEKSIVPKENIPYEELEIYGFTKDIKRDIKNIFLLNKAYKKCLRIIKNFKPDVVIGVGGYVTYPVIKAAHKLKIKTFIHEQNSRPGKVNFLTSSISDVVGITFLSSKNYFKKAKKIVYTGHPSLDSAKKTKVVDKTTLGFSKEKKLVLYVAGSLGSSSLNEKMLDYLNSEIDENVEILYIVGSNINLEDFKSKIKNKKNYIKVLPYFENLPSIIAASDVVISRAGAGVLFEIISLLKPSIVIPSPNVSNNHQYYNALELYEKEMIEMVLEKDLTKEILKEKIDLLLNDKEKVKKMKENMLNYRNVNPLDTIYKIIKDLGK